MSWPNVQLTTVKADSFQSILLQSIFYLGWKWYGTSTWWPICWIYQRCYMENKLLMGMLLHGFRGQKNYWKIRTHQNNEWWKKKSCILLNWECILSISLNPCDMKAEQCFNWTYTKSHQLAMEIGMDFSARELVL